MEREKGKLYQMYSDNYYFLVASSLFVIIGLVSIVWTLYDMSVANRFDINNIVELNGIVYNAIYYEDVDVPYVTVEAEILEDKDLVQIQHSLYKDSQEKVPVYWVKNNESFLPDNQFYQEGIIKKSLMVDNGLHEVTSFENIYLSESDANIINDWNIDSGEFVNGVYIVTGSLPHEENSLDKYSQLKALSEVILSLNKDNELLVDSPILLDFETGDDKVLYHTSHEDILGKSSLYQSKKTEP